MVRHGAKGYFAGCRVVGQGEHEVKIYWSMRERNLTLDTQPVKKLTDYLGVLRAVVFCTEDLQLIKGTARIRRRFLDLLLSQTHAGYLPLLQRYTQSLRSRNALLKQPIVNPETLQSFAHELIATGEEIMRLRRELVPLFSPLIRAGAQRMGASGEEVQVRYSPSIKADFAVELAQSQPRERAYRSTVVGPHRDELEILLDDRLAAQFSSEGQKRTLAIAFKMAQAEYLAGIYGAPPILLIDDVMGELDLRRRGGFVPLLEKANQSRGQVFMTATEENWPRELGGEVQRWQVHKGVLQRKV